MSKTSLLAYLELLEKPVDCHEICEALANLPSVYESSPLKNRLHKISKEAGVEMIFISKTARTPLILKGFCLTEESQRFVDYEPPLVFGQLPEDTLAVMGEAQLTREANYPADSPIKAGHKEKILAFERGKYLIHCQFDHSARLYQINLNRK